MEGTTCSGDIKEEKLYVEFCPQKRQNIYPFILSMDVLLSTEAEATLKLLVGCFVDKWWRPYSCTCIYVNSRVLISLVVVTRYFIHGFQVPTSHTSVKHPHW